MKNRINRRVISTTYNRNPKMYSGFLNRYNGYIENLNEATRKDIIAGLDKATNRRQKEQPIYAFYEGIDNKEIKFKVTSGTTKGVFWRQRIRIKDFDKIVKSFIKDKNYKEKDWVSLLLDSDIEVHCDCPAYKYYWQNIATDLSYAIEEEHREPNIRNPSRKGTVCKHIAKVLIYLPNNKMSIIKDINRIYGNKLPIKGS